MCERMCLCKCTPCIHHRCARISTDVHVWRSEQEQACLLSVHSKFSAYYKISSEIAYSQGKFNEKLVGVIGELVSAIIIELGPMFGQNCSQSFQKLRNDKFGLNKCLHIRTHFFSICPKYPLTFVHLPPTWRTGERWRTANRHNRTHLFTFAATSIFGECTCSLVFSQTHLLSVYAALDKEKRLCVCMLYLQRPYKHVEWKHLVPKIDITFFFYHKFGTYWIFYYLTVFSTKKKTVFSEKISWKMRFYICFHLTIVF